MICRIFFILFFLFGLEAKIELDAVPTEIEKRFCTNDEILWMSSCLLYGPVLNYEQASKFCELRGGELVENITIPRYLPYWSNNLGKPYAWEVKNRKAKLSLQNRESRFQIVCERKMLTLPGECPPNYRSAGMKCYRIFGDLYNSVEYLNRRTELEKIIPQKCKEDGAQLAKLKNKMDYSIVLSLMQGFSSVNIMVEDISTRSLEQEKKNSIIIHGDSEVRPGLMTPLREIREFGLFGFACEKALMRNKDGQKRSSKNSDKCRDGFEKLQKEHSLCFKRISKLEKTWSEAQKMCENEKSSLASIHSHYDNAIVYLLRLRQRDDMWIGIRKMNDSWSDGTRIVFNESSINFDKNKCAVMNKDGEWSYIDCFSRMEFYCFIRTDEKKPLPKPCNGKKVKFRQKCYTKTKTESSKVVETLSKDQVGFLLEFAQIKGNQCLEVNETKYVVYETDVEKKQIKHLDFRGRLWKYSDSCSIQRIFEVTEPPTTITTPPTDKRGATDSAILIISILSSLLGVIMIALLVGITVYCLVFRSKAARPQGLEAEMKPSQKAQPLPRPATVGNLPPRNVPQLPPSLPTLPKPYEEEVITEDIYESMEDVRKP